MKAQIYLPKGTVPFNTEYEKQYNGSEGVTLTLSGELQLPTEERFNEVKQTFFMKRRVERVERTTPASKWYQYPGKYEQLISIGYPIAATVHVGTPAYYIIWSELLASEGSMYLFIYNTDLPTIFLGKTFYQQIKDFEIANGVYAPIGVTQKPKPRAIMVEVPVEYLPDGFENTNPYPERTKEVLESMKPESTYPPLITFAKK